MKLPKRVYVIAAVLLFVAGGATTLALQPEPPEQIEQKKDTVQFTSVVEKPEAAPQQEVVTEQSPTPTPAPQAVEPEAPANPFETESGFSTWYVWNRRQEVGKLMPTPSKPSSHANYCSNLLSEKPEAFGSVPTQHGIACVTGARGHSAFIEEVNADGSFWVTEMNSRGQVSKTDQTPAGGFGVVDWKLIPATNTSFKYIP